MTMTAFSSAGNKARIQQLPHPKSGPRPSDRWIPWYFVAFFAVVVGALVIFAWIAVTTEPGLVTKDAYQKGLNYDQIIAASDAAAEIPWQASIAVQRQGDSVNLAVTIHDDRNSPITDVDVEAWWIRPTQDKQDQHWKMTEQNKGLFVANGSLPMKGAWDVHITAAMGKQQKQFVQSVIID